jgi:hypothetical protein
MPRQRSSARRPRPAITVRMSVLFAARFNFNLTMFLQRDSKLFFRLQTIQVRVMFRLRPAIFNSKYLERSGKAICQGDNGLQTCTKHGEQFVVMHGVIFLGVYGEGSS